MPDKNSAEDVFRFLQIRPPLAATPGPTIVLDAERPLATELVPLSGTERTARANAWLKANVSPATQVATRPEARRAEASAHDVLHADGPVAALATAYSAGHLAQDRDTILKHSEVLEDLLIAAKFASDGIPRNINHLARLFRLFSALLHADAPSFASIELRQFLRRPVALPPAFGPDPGVMWHEPASPDRRVTSGSRAPTVDGDRVQMEACEQAIQELVSLVRTHGLESSTGDPERPGSSRVPLVLPGVALARLTPAARDAIGSVGLDPARFPVPGIVAALERSALASATRIARGGPARLPPTTVAERPGGPPPLVRPYLRSAGIADLLVVKQHLVRYERLDIAHVENILIGEKKSRNHRALERSESTFLSERETTRERETELQTADRFEMQREATLTAKEDQQFGFGLSLSGKYGPSVEFTSNAQLDTSSSTEQTVRSSTSYAKDILSRSLERVIERVREEQRRTVVRETEETNLHELDNQTSAHVIGTYQFLEKVYASQVFNYGIRAMFDFMVPEPASYLWALEKSPATELHLPEPPPKLESFIADARAISASNFPELAARFGAEGVAGPPSVFVTASVALKSGDGGSEEGKPQSMIDKDVPVPQGYVPVMATVRPLALTDNVLTIGITVGRQQFIWAPRTAPEVISTGGSFSMASREIVIFLGSTGEDYQGALPVQALAFESHTFGLTVDVVFVRSASAYEAWQTKTYDAIASAYQNLVQQYDQDVAELKARAQADAEKVVATRFGTPPSQNLKTVRDELKKHCLSVVTRQWYDGFDAVNDDSPPTFDFQSAEQQGAFTRFFEQAFEWDQTQYVFYPYFWARKSTWAERFNREEVDPMFLDFLRAGSARVVVPVRPGFEVALTHYLETGFIWNGLGDPPEINSPLYVPIVTEIQERTGSPQGEIAVGEPWLTHLPTPLAIVRREDDLPEWERQDPESWEWREKA